MKKNKTIVTIMAVFLAVASIFCLLKPADEFSQSERRKLAGFPAFSFDKVLSRTFMEEFEEYALDQIPFREGFRNLKAGFFHLLGQKDNNGYYVTEGHLSKLEYPLNEKSVTRATKRICYLYDKYLKDSKGKAYISVIPDKNYFLAEKNGYLSIDYERLFQAVKENTKELEYIDIEDLLSIEDYYRTDSHWKQEQIVDVAGRLGTAMGIHLSSDYEVKTLEAHFYGSYYGQLAASIEPDKINYLTNDVISFCMVHDYENNRDIGIYNLEKERGKDLYEVFLSGPLSLLSIENSKADTTKELILFRDSFGSSLAPLLAEGYRKITLVDIRYIHPDLLEKYIEFHGQDVLFLYSTSVLNHGETMK